MSSLAEIIGQIESGNNPGAPLTDYAGNRSVNAQYQQSAAYVAQYGSGETGILNQANGLLASNPNATLGDFYSLYNHGSVLPFSTYSSRFPLQANNFVNGAAQYGANENTPLSSLTGQSANPFSSSDQSSDPSNDPLGFSVTENQSSALPHDPAMGVDTGDISSILSGAGGQPVNITDLPGLDTSISKGATGLGTSVTGAAQTAAQTLANGLNALQTYTSNLFVVVALVVLGVIFIAFGLGLFGKRELVNA